MQCNGTSRRKERKWKDRILFCCYVTSRTINFSSPWQWRWYEISPTSDHCHLTLSSLSVSFYLFDARPRRRISVRWRQFMRYDCSIARAPFANGIPSMHSIGADLLRVKAPSIHFQLSLSLCCLAPALHSFAIRRHVAICQNSKLTAIDNKKPSLIIFINLKSFTKASKRTISTIRRLLPCSLNY